MYDLNLQSAVSLHLRSSAYIRRHLRLRFIFNTDAKKNYGRVSLISNSYKDIPLSCITHSVHLQQQRLIEKHMIFKNKKEFDIKK